MSLESEIAELRYQVALLGLRSPAQIRRAVGYTSVAAFAKQAGVKPSVARALESGDYPKATMELDQCLSALMWQLPYTVPRREYALAVKSLHPLTWKQLHNVTDLRESVA